MGGNRTLGEQGPIESERKMGQAEAGRDRGREGPITTTVHVSRM